MKSLAGAILLLMLPVLSCTGQMMPVPPSQPASGQASSVVVRISKPQNLIVQQKGTSFVVNPGSERQWAQGFVRASGAVCAALTLAGFHYGAFDVSDAGLTMAITCIADGSKYQVRVIFVPDSG